jgi:DNA-binding MarR family transcriptional regulator
VNGERALRPVSRAGNAAIGNTLLVGPTETAAAARPRKRSAPEAPVPDAPQSEVPNDEEVIGAILLASRVMVGIAVRSLAGNPDDVTLPQYRTLVELAFGGPRRLADLAEALSVSPSTATRMCDRLVRKELVSRTRDELDRREVKLTITALGRKVVSDVIERRRAEVRDMLLAIPIPLRRQLVNSLTLLATAAGEAPELHWGPGWF